MAKWQDAPITKDTPSAIRPTWQDAPVTAILTLRPPRRVPEPTLETARASDMDDIMSEEIDTELLVGQRHIDPLGVASQYVSREELLADFRLTEFLRLRGVAGRANMEAHKIGAMAASGETTAVGVWKNVRTNWNDAQERDNLAAEKASGALDILLSELNVNLKAGAAFGKNFVSGTAQMLALLSANIERLADRARYNRYSRKVFELLTSRDLTPQERPSGYRGERWPEPGGGRRTLVAVEKVIQEHPSWQAKQVEGGIIELIKDREALAGRVGGALPVMLAAIGATATGGPPAAIALIYTIESEAEYQQAIASGVSEEEANLRGDIVGTINAVIEFAQVGHMKRLFNLGGGRQVITRVAVAKAKKTLAARALKGMTSERIRQIVLNSIGEAVEEAAQGTVGELAALGISGEEIKAGFVSRRLEEGLIAGLLSAGAVGTGVALRRRPGGPVEPGAVPGAPPVPEGMVPPVTNISHIMPATEIVARVDVDQLGKTLVEDIAAPEGEIELAAAPPKRRTIAVVRREAARMGVDVSDITGKGAVAAIEARLTEAEKARPLPERGRKPLTVEEQHQLKQTEATLAAEESLTIKPELYIGSVTPRMRQVFAEALGVSPEEIGPFLKGPFPTKRTEIELTMSQGREYLFHLETSLQERLDNNQIHSHHDLALANADWGDIKELRKRLGLVTVTRPFIIDRDQITKIVTIENVKERIRKTVHVAEGDIIAITEMDRLNAVMRKVAKSTTEGFKLGKAEARRSYAELQYLRKQKEIRERLIARIQAKPSKEIDFFFREAIKQLQAAIDFKTTTEQKQLHKETLRALLDKHPDKAANIPPERLEQLGQKDVLSLSHTDLRTIDEEIQRLSRLGRLQSKRYQALRSEAVRGMGERAVTSIGAAKPSILPNMERAWTLRSTRVFDMLDGGQNFEGELYGFFYGTTNANVDVELRNTDARHLAMRNRLNELGLTHNALTQVRTIGNLTLPLDDFLSIVAGWKNPASRAALRYGGVMQKIKGKETFVEITDAMITEIEESLSDTEKTWADTIIKEYDEHYDRLRLAIIRAENRDPGRQHNYTKMRRIGVEYKSTEQEMVNALAMRHFFSQVGPHKAFTLKRKDIDPKYQQPIELGLTKIWLAESRKQEHYINNVAHLKDMRAVANRKDFRAAVTEKFGRPMVDTIDTYIDRIANPDYYKAHTDIERASKVLRKHTSIAYVGANLSTMMIQGPSLLLYWADSSVADMLSATADAVLHPMESFERAKAIHYQIAHQHIERELSEMRAADAGAYERAVNKIGRASFFGILAIDRGVRVIGINAVYNKAIRDGLSVAEAREKASGVTLRTQPAAHPKDLARLYSTNELLNWFTMFTNQLNQIYNITTYDIPTAWHNGNYRAAARSAMALGTMAMLVWIIRNGRLPEEPEEVAAAFAEQSISAVPLAGRYIVSGAQGWDASAPAPFKALAGVGSAAAAIAEGDMEKAVGRLVEPLSVGMGLPYHGAKDIYKLLAEQ